MKKTIILNNIQITQVTLFVLLWDWREASSFHSPRQDAGSVNRQNSKLCSCYGWHIAQDGKHINPLQFRYKMESSD